MSATNMGYKFKLYYGAANATASTLITNSRDADYDCAPTYGDTSKRGDGSAPVIETEEVTALKPTITWQMLNKPSDTTLQALLTAGSTGGIVAIRTKDYTSGKGYDGDCNIAFKEGAPYKGEQTFDFTATANDSNRDPQLWV